MFAQSFTRFSRVASSQLRRYATEVPKTSSSASPVAASPPPQAPKPSGGSNTLLLAGVGAAGAAGAYYYLQSSGTSNTATHPVNPTPAKKIFTGGEQGFVSLKLDSVEVINHNTKKLRFHLGDDDAVSGLATASALLTKYKGPEQEKPVVRPYTPVSDEDTKGYLDLLIKKYPGGPMSTHLHDLVPGQRLDIKGPIPKYPWEANKHEHIGLIGGGTGITPLYQVARAIFKNPEDKTKVTLVFGNVKEEDILLKHEFEQLENEYPNRFRAFYVLDQPPEKWQAGSGRITKELLKTVLPGPDGANTKIFVCGPPGLYKAVSGTKKSPQDQGELDGYLKDLGYTKEQVYKF